VCLLGMRLPTDFVLKSDQPLKTSRRITLAAALGLSCVAVMILPVAISPASALVGAAGSSLQRQLSQDNSQDSSIIQVRRGGGMSHAGRGGGGPHHGAVAGRGGGAHRTTVVGPRGGAASRTVVHRGAVAGVRPGRWVRPSNYYWRPGGAIAAGAAIGFVTAATAAAWAGAPPAPGSCWYYTDPSRTQGFWDVCQ
jgi:hypothetical protein